MMTTLTAEQTVTVRPIAIADLPLCETFAREFYAEKHLTGVLDFSRFVSTWTYFLSKEHAKMFGLWYDERLVGGLGAMIAPDLYDGRSIATELFWYVTPDARHGLHPWKLIEAFEAWGESQFVDEYRVTHMLLPGEDPSTVRLAPIYTRKKYRAHEVNYLKRARGGVSCH